MKLLTIRREQMDAFDARARDGFREQAYRILAAQQPRVLGEMGPDGLRHEVGRGLDRALGYGLKTEADVLRFLTLLCERGFDVERRPDGAWIKKILDSATVAGGSKMDLIERLS